MPSKANLPEPEITDKDLPALFQAADTASKSGQKAYIRLMAADLVLLSAAAALEAVATHTPDVEIGLSISSAVVLLISLILTIAIKTSHPERRWYDGRAISESVKTLSWRYMTSSEPYPNVLSSDEVDRKFANDLTSILAERKEFLFAPSGTDPEITERMRAARSLPLSKKVDFYRFQRIESQQRWYSQKSAKNGKLEAVWFWAVITAQVLAAISAVFLVRWPESPVRLTSLFATFASVFLAWLQLKQHQELAQSYAVAAQELGIISSGANHLATDGDLSSFVSDAENAISREHTLWIARRDRR